MKNRTTLLLVLLAMALVLSLVVPASVAGVPGSVPLSDNQPVDYSAADGPSLASAMALNTPESEVTPMVAAGASHTVGLKSDGTVVTVGDNEYGQCNVCSWSDIVQVAAGYAHTAGVKSDGTVVAVGHNTWGWCDVGSWTDIIQAAAGDKHTVGLKSDGTVVAVGTNGYGQCNVDGWSDIVQVTAGKGHTVGLKADGTVVDTSYNVGGWKDIIQVAAGGFHTVGLKSDGTAVAVGASYSGQCDVGNWTDIVQVAAGYHYTLGLKSDGTAVAVGDNGWGRCDVGGWTDIVQVATGYSHTVGLKSDGTVVAVGYNEYGQCDVGGWPGIIQVDAGGRHTVGLKKDGTVVAVGSGEKCNFGDWTAIIQVAAGGYHTVGLKSDGTVVAVGDNDDGQCDVGGWMDIIQVAVGGAHTVGLKTDGTVVAVGDNDDGQCDVGGWTDIVQVAASGSHTVGLKTDGTVVAVGENYGGRCDVSGWTNIVQVAAGYSHTVGLKNDGTVIAVGSNNHGQCNVGGWTDIVQVAASGSHTVGLKSDGTVVAVGDNDDGQCDVGGWTDIVQIAANRDKTVGLKDDGTAIVTSGGGAFSAWNLVLSLPQSQCALTISSTAGGSVSTPGEGGGTYNPGRVIELVAKAEEGYQFVKWTGDVYSIADANAAQTTITMEGHYVITAKFALQPGMHTLTVSSTEGGSVTAPGEGTFVYKEGTVVDLVAKAEKGYRFDCWVKSTGRHASYDETSGVAKNIAIDTNYSVVAVFEFVSLKVGNVGIKAGDWIEFEYTVTNWPDEVPYTESLKLEFLSIEDTSANVLVTMNMSDGTEQSDTVPLDVVSGGQALGLSGLVISADLTRGDPVYFSGYGDVTIEGETTRTYVGARRRVVYTSLTLYGGAQLTFYWDKQTGVMVETSTTYGDVTATGKVTETNMWEASIVRKLWWLWVIIAVAIAGGAFAVCRLRRKKRPTAPMLPPEGS